MSWVSFEKKLSENEIYDLVKHHRLAPRSPEDAIAMCRALGAADHHQISAGVGGPLVAHLFVLPGGNVTFLPKPKYFTRPDVFLPKLEPVMRPLLQVYLGKYGRLFSEVPVSRSRSKRALKGLGFETVGRPREAFRPFDAEPEDTWIFDLLDSDLEEDDE